MGHEEVIQALRKFVDDRDWQQFHSPENLAKSISIESAELLELYQWGEEPDIERIREELADVLAYCFHLADNLGIDVYEAVLSKIVKNEEKYPIDKSKGSSAKYDRF